MTERGQTLLLEVLLGAGTAALEGRVYSPRPGEKGWKETRFYWNMFGCFVLCHTASPPH